MAKENRKSGRYVIVVLHCTPLQKNFRDYLETAAPRIAYCYCIKFIVVLKHSLFRCCGRIVKCDF